MLNRKTAPAHPEKRDTKMSTESEEKEPNKEKTDEREVKVVPEGTFGGTVDKPIFVEGGKPVPEDTGDQGGGQN
jgi:hypothetical protein